MSTELRETIDAGTEAESLEVGQDFFSDAQEKFSGEVQESAEIAADDFSDLLDGIEGTGESDGDGGEPGGGAEGFASESIEAAPAAAPLADDSSADRLVEAKAGDEAASDPGSQGEPARQDQVKIVADTPTGPTAIAPPPGTMYQGWGFISVAPPDPLAKLRQKVNQQKQAVADAHMAVMDAQDLVKEVKKELEEEVEMLRGLMKELRSAEQEQEENEGGGGISGGSEDSPFGGSSDPSGIAQETRSPVRLVESSLQGDPFAVKEQGQPQEQQAPLVFETPEPEVDEAGSRELWILSLTDSQIEKLREHDVRTVAQLEEFMREGNFVPGRIKGIGEQAINKITDSLMAYRKEHPVPQIVTADDLQCAYGAGQVAAEDGSDISMNPHRRGTALAGAWDRGYTEWESPVVKSVVGDSTIQFDGDGNLSESEEEKLRHAAQCKLEMESALYGDQRYNTVNPIQPFPLPDSQ